MREEFRLVLVGRRVEPSLCSTSVQARDLEIVAGTGSSPLRRLGTVHRVGASLCRIKTGPRAASYNENDAAKHANFMRKELVEMSYCGVRTG